MAQGEKPDQFVKSLDRALDIIEKLIEVQQGMGVTELSNSLGLHKSTVYRLLATLSYRGYVKKNRSNNKYETGMKLLEIGSRALENLELRREVKPYLQELGKKTGETVHLGILDENEVIYIDKEETRATIRMHSKIGKRVPTHCTSLGKVLLAFSPPPIREEVIKNSGLKQYTENTITDEECLRKHLQQVKNQYYAVDNQEMEEGIRCIAGPIFDYRGELIAAFSISGPSTRITEGRIQELSQIVQSYSTKISSSFGYKS